MELFKLFGTIAIKNSQANEAIDETTGKAAQSESKMSSTFKKIGAAVTTYFAVDRIVDFGKKIVTVGENFDSAMSKVAAISGATGTNFDALRQKAKAMGAATKFTASEAADAFTYMAMAGWKTSDMLSGIDGIMNLAAASGEDLATTSDIVTDALTAFGLKASDSAHFADVLAAASNNANTNVSMLGGSFKYVAPVAGALGYSIEDVSVALGLMANSGIKAEQAGTSMRAMLSRLASPTKDVSDAFSQIGITAKDALTNADGSMKPLSETIQILRSKMAGLDEATKASVASGIAGQEAMSGLLAIISASDEDFNKLTSAINKADGTAQKMSNTMLNNLGGDVTIAKSAFEGFQLNLYDKFEPSLRKVVQAFTDFIGKLTNVTNKVSEFITWFNSGSESAAKLKETIKAVARVVGVLTTAFVGLKAGMMIQKAVNGFQTAKVTLSLFAMQANGASFAQAALNGTLTLGETIVGLLTGKITLAQLATGLWAKGQAALNAVMSANPIAFVIAGIVALIAVFVILWNKCEGFRNFWINLWDKIKTAFAPVIEFVKSSFESFKEKLQTGIVPALQDLWAAIKEKVLPVLSLIWDYVQIYIQPAFEWLKTGLGNIKIVFQTIFTVIKTIVSTAFENIKTVITTVWNNIKIVISTVLDVIKNIIKLATSIIKGDWKGAWEAIKGIFSSIWNGIKGIVSNVWNAIKSIFSNNLNAIKSSVSTVFNGVKAVIQNTINGAKNIVKSGLDAIKNFFSKLKLKFPSIKLPHFSIKGSFSLKPPSVPKLSVDWYAKAMKNAMLLNQPTIFGVNPNGNLMGGGEAGQEVVAGSSTLMAMIRNAVQNENAGIIYYLDKLISMLTQYFPEILGNLEREMVLDDGTLVAKITPKVDKKLGDINRMKERGQ